MTTQLGMDPGMLTEEIEILEKKAADDGQGGREVQWPVMPSGFEWARIRPLSGRRRPVADQSEARAHYEVTIRYRDDLHEDYRVRWVERDLEFEITSDPALGADERKEYLSFTIAKVRD